MRSNITKILIVCAGVGVLQGMLLVVVFVFSGDASQNSVKTQADRREAVETFLPLVQKTTEPLVLDRFGETRSTLLANGGEFLEINFSQDRVFRYKNGEIAEEAVVLAKGDPQGWGGTPAGLYSVLSKNEQSFSNISQVYMPYAVHFYGKYLVHGEPFYPSGVKLASDVSGGCIRLKDSQAQSVYGLLNQGTPVLVVDKENDGYRYTAGGGAPPPAVSATSYLVADVDSGFVFAEKHSTKQFPIASITKLMTALVVAENVDLRKSVEVTWQMLEAYGETDGLEQGKSYRVVELFYPLLVASSNDAAEAVAGFLGRDRTLRMMNEKAQVMLLRDTVFTDPSGFDVGNVSTAQDVFYVARYILHNRPPLLEITKGKDVRSYGEPQFARQELWNKNVFAGDSSFVGGKTGYITASKHTGVFLFRFLTKEQETRTVAFVILGSGNSKLDTQMLYAWLSKNYALEPQYAI